MSSAAMLRSVKAAGRCQRRHIRPYDCYAQLRQHTTQNVKQVDVGKLLEKPSWSVVSLLPPKDSKIDPSKGLSKQLHHLLRLSALPPPKDSQEETRMLETLASQLHFVEDIQKVDTTGVEPLRSLRDETLEGEREAELGLDALKEALDMEEVRGQVPQKNKDTANRRHEEQQRGLGCAWERFKEGWEIFCC